MTMMITTIGATSTVGSWIEGTTRRATSIRTLVLLLCVTLSFSMPTSTFSNAAVTGSARATLPRAQNHLVKLLTQSTVPDAVKFDSAFTPAITTNISTAFSAVNKKESSSNIVILSTAQTAETNRISTRRRRMSSRNDDSDKPKQLYCRTDYWLAIYDNETINGTKERSDLYTHLRLTTHSFGKVKIQGVLSGMYVCMDENGKVYPSPRHSHECTFAERYLKSLYTVFLSTSHPQGRKKWYIGMNSNGRTRPGYKTRSKHQMAQFLLVNIEDS